MTMRLRVSVYILMSCALLIGALTTAFAQGNPAAGPAAPAGPVPGTTLRDNLQPLPDSIRTLPQQPRVGAWAMLLGRPATSESGAGLQIEKTGQGIVYPTTELLSGATGTIQFNVQATTAVDPADATARVLMDSWANGGPARMQLLVQSGKLTFKYIDDKNQAKTIEGNVAWAANSFNMVTLLWDATDITLQVGNTVIGQIEKPTLANREPLGIVLGNDKELKNPAKMAFSALRFSTAREAQAPANTGLAEDNTPSEELALRMARGYDRRLYPMLEQLRRQNVVEANFAYALAYSDIGDLDRAMQSITPIAKDPNHPLYVLAVFLRADLLVRQRDYFAANDQLDVLAGSSDRSIQVRAQVKKATVLFEQGSKQEAIRLVGDIIAKNPDMPEINDAYLMIGLERFRNGDYQSALVALTSVGVPGAPPRRTVAIWGPLDIKVADADLNVRIADVGLPVTVVVKSGDMETVTLKPAFSRGVYTGSVDVTLGEPKANDGILQVQGNDHIEVGYIDRLATDGTNVKRSFGVDLATDAELVLLAQSALDVYREVLDYQKKNIIDEYWNLVGTLPKNASAFFRNADDGILRKKPFRFSRAFIENIKPGQSLYVELNEPDEDRSAQPDTMEVELVTQSNRATPMKVQLTETGPRTGIFAATVPTVPVGQEKPNALTVTMNDVVTARYRDQHPAGNAGEKQLTSRVSITSVDGKLACGLELLDPGSQEERTNVFVRVYRVQPNSTVTVTIEDRDLDVSDAADKVTVKAVTDSGVEVPITLTETGTHTGMFSGKMTVSSDPATVAPKVKVKPGETLKVIYNDDENRSGKPIEREYALRINTPENAIFTFQRRLVEQPKIEKTAPKGQSVPPPKISWEDTTALVPGSVYRLILVDPDLVPTQAGDWYIKVQAKSANGATVDIPLRAYLDDKAKITAFSGDFYVRLGDASNPARAYFSQTGAVMEIKEDEQMYNQWSMPAVNIQGKDKVQMVYTEPLSADGKKGVPNVKTLRVAADALITTLNMQGNVLEQLKPGMPFELQIDDANGDITPKRDTLKATISSTCGDKLTVELTETDVHTGIFSALVKTVFGTTAVATNELVEVPFEGKVTISYRDEETIIGTAADRAAELATRQMAEADGVLLTKVYDDPKFEVETIVRLGESLYAVGAAELATAKIPKGQPRTNAKLQESARLLQQVIDRFPTSDYVVESLYLTGKIRGEEQKLEEAEKMFARVIEEYPDTEFVPQALYQLVLLYYGRNDIDKATEAAMRLVYGFPKNPLVADAVLRIAEYYYNKKDYITAAFIYKRVIDRFPDNPRVDLINYRMATAYYRSGVAGDNVALANAIRYYLEFVEAYKDHELADDALYWAANAYMKQNNVRRAYTLLTKLLITYPNQDMKAYATRMRDTIKEEHPGIEADQF